MISVPALVSVELFDAVAAQLAEQAGTTQSAVARLEAGRTAPTLEHLTTLVRACGFDLEVRLVPYDEHGWSMVQRNLTLTPDERLAKVVKLHEFVDAARRARGATRGT